MVNGLTVALLVYKKIFVTITFSLPSGQLIRAVMVILRANIPNGEAIMKRTGCVMLLWREPEHGEAI